jgi:hypothetical protein
MGLIGFATSELGKAAVTPLTYLIFLWFINLIAAFL